MSFDGTCNNQHASQPHHQDKLLAVQITPPAFPTHFGFLCILDASFRHEQIQHLVLHRRDPDPFQLTSNFLVPLCPQDYQGSVIWSEDQNFLR